MRRALVLLLALAGAAACGATTTVPSGGTLTVGITEYRLAPQSIRVPAGPVTLVARNRGRLAHNLLVSENGTTVAVTKPIAPGGYAVLSVDLAPGHYTVASNLFDDEALGLYGSLTATG